MMNDKVTIISSPPGLGRRVSDPSETKKQKMTLKSYIVYLTYKLYQFLVNIDVLFLKACVKENQPWKLMCSWCKSFALLIHCLIILSCHHHLIPNFDLFSTFAAKDFPSNLWLS